MAAQRFADRRPPLKNSRRAWCLGCLGAAVSTFASAQLNAEATRDLHVVNGTLTPEQRLIKVYKGDRLRWRVTSSASGSLHLHAYRLSLQLQAGQAQELAFTAFATGRFRVEWHAAGEPAHAASGHHAPLLAVLEVRPR